MKPEPQWPCRPPQGRGALHPLIEAVRVTPQCSAGPPNPRGLRNTSQSQKWASNGVEQGRGLQKLNRRSLPPGGLGWVISLDLHSALRGRGACRGGLSQSPSPRASQGSAVGPQQERVGPGAAFRAQLCCSSRVPSWATPQACRNVPGRAPVGLFLAPGMGTDPAGSS